MQCSYIVRRCAKVASRQSPFRTIRSLYIDRSYQANQLFKVTLSISMFFLNHHKYNFFPRSNQSMLIHFFNINLSCKVAPLCNVMRSCQIRGSFSKRLNALTQAGSHLGTAQPHQMFSEYTFIRFLSDAVWSRNTVVYLVIGLVKPKQTCMWGELGE